MIMPKQERVAAVGGSGESTRSTREGTRQKKEKATKGAFSIKIKPFSNPPQLPADFYDTSTSLLLQSMYCVLHHTSPPSGQRVGREELYRRVEDLCTHGYGTDLYHLVVDLLKEAAIVVASRLASSSSTTTIRGAAPDCVQSNGTVYFSTAGGSFAERSSDAANAQVLSAIYGMWNDYVEYLNCVRSIFLHLDRRFVYSPQSSSILPRTDIAGWSLWEVGMLSLLSHISRAQEGISIVAALQKCTIATFLAELDGHATEKPLTRNCVSILGTIGFTSGGECIMLQFLTEVVASLVVYLEEESLKWMHSGQYDTKTFLHHVDTRLKQLHAMTLYYLLSAPTSEQRNTNILTNIAERHLLTPHFTKSHVLHPTTLYPLLDDESKIIPDVRRLYLLSKRVIVHDKDADVEELKLTGVERLKVAFGEYGRERGYAIVRVRFTKTGAASKPSPAALKESKSKIIPNLLAFKCHLEMLQSKAFFSGGDEEAFGRCVKSILEDVVNAGGDDDDDDDNNGDGDALATFARKKEAKQKRQHGGDGGKLVAELLAKHVDLRFKNAKSSASSGGTMMMMITDEDTNANNGEAFQNAILSLFRHVHSKDVFEAFYKRDLAKRLLLNKSTSTDEERTFVSKLKAECGSGYTGKMEGMFKDMDLSRDVMGSYSAFVSSGSTELLAGVDMDVKVLTTGYWPVYPQFPTLILPPALMGHKDQFESYYKTKYQGRRIVWQHFLGNCIVRAHFPKIGGVRELVVSLCQAVVLLCFNEDHVALTIADVMKKTGLDDRGEAERVLQSLSMGRDGTRVLSKIDYDYEEEEAVVVEKDKDVDGSSRRKNKMKKVRLGISDRDTFVFNTAFTSNQHRIRITNVQMRETTEERSKTHESVSRDRLYLIDAAIVRIMKARKSLDHRGLVGEVMNQLKFPATGVDVKKRIESLLEREYMERMEGDRAKYKYLA